MKKIYSVLMGKCSVHHTRKRPLKSWRRGWMCEVNAELIFCRYKDKKILRRKARRHHWGQEEQEL